MLKLNILFLSFLLLITMNLSLTAQKKADKIIEFTGYLEKGKSYFTEIEFVGKFNEWQPVKKLILPYHHAGRIEWINLEKFSVLHKSPTRSQPRIAFKIISKKVYQAGKNRWNTIYYAKILYLIPK